MAFAVHASGTQECSNWVASVGFPPLRSTNDYRAAIRRRVPQPFFPVVHVGTKRIPGSLHSAAQLSSRLESERLERLQQEGTSVIICEGGEGGLDCGLLSD